MDGVTSTSIAAVEVQGFPHAATVGIWHEIVFPCAVSQVPALLPVALAVRLLTWMVLACTVATTFNRVAASGPVLMMSKVNAAGAPAATGLGVGLLVGFKKLSLLWVPILVTKASCEPAFKLA